MNCTVTAVVVSYNRKDLLQECLDGIASQTRQPDHTIVIENASTDGAREIALNHASHPQVIALTHNVGGAGGFCAGIAEAVVEQNHRDTHFIELAHEAGNNEPIMPQHYIWLMDDDTVPTPTALEELLHAVDASIESNGILPTVLGSQAQWIDGREHLMNKPRRRTFKCKGKRHLKGSDGAYQVRSLSFVSCLINAGAVVGLERLPHSAYFLWNDDFEYTTTLLKNGVGYYVPQSVVVHKTKVFGSSDADPGARFYNEVRNKIWMMRFSRSSFTRAEYIEFVLKTARRWLLTLQHGDDRDLLRDCFKRGWHDGWHSEPRSNEQIFADMPKIAYDIAAVENILGKAFANDAQ